MGNNILSKTLSVNTGICQGTILGPLIFIFYINDVIRNVNSRRVNIYADDCLIYTIGNNWNIMSSMLQDDCECFPEMVC